MAQTVHLRLEIDGNDIEGESTIRSLDREGTIECSSFYYGLAAAFDPANFAITGRRQHQPIRIHKRIDKTTPLLIKAVCENAMVEGLFRFYRPSPTGDGTEEQFYTVRIEEGRIASVSQVSEDPIMGGEAAPPMMEEVTFVFGVITWLYEEGGVEYRDQLR